MPLASLHFFQQFGPCMASLVVSDIAIGQDLQPKREIKPRLDAGGVGTAEMRPWRGQYAAVEGSGLGLAELAAKRKINIGLEVSIGGSLTQDDVTGAVLEAPLEGDISVKQALRILLAHAAGDATGLEGASQAFKSQDGTKTRIAGTYSGGTRVVTSVDGS
jgi:hypothetical protein